MQEVLRVLVTVHGAPHGAEVPAELVDDTHANDVAATDTQ